MIRDEVLFALADELEASLAAIEDEDERRKWQEVNRLLLEEVRNLRRRSFQ